MTLPPTTEWRKSSYSNGMGGECVEVAMSVQDVAVRDSKVPHGPQLILGAAAWGDFVGTLPHGWISSAARPDREHRQGDVTMPAFEFEKSAYSSGNGECVEVATNFIGTVAVRDSKIPEGPVLQFPASAWAEFLGQTMTR